MKIDAHWRLIDNGAGSGPENMAIDEAILNGCQYNASVPALHLYTWKTPAITLGYLQDPYSALNIERCIASRIEVLKRMTGGKAVVHHKDLGFSLIFPKKGSAIPSGIGPSYRKVAQGVINALESLGIDAYLVDGRPVYTFSPRERRDLSACFLTRIRHEVLVDGRKLVGIAQRRIGGWVLIQGTIMIGLDRVLWADLLRHPDAFNREMIMDRFMKDMTALWEITEKRPAISDIKAALMDGFSRHLGIGFARVGLSTEEIKERGLLMNDRYRDLLRDVPVLSDL